MTYDGSVRVGGPEQTRQAGGLAVTKVAVGPYDNNAYLLTDSGTGERLLVDAGAEPDRLLALVGTDDGPLSVVTTHRHADHWQALAAVVAATGARTLAGEHDAEGIDMPTDLALADGDEVAVGHSRLRVIELVGHTPGSIALLYAGDPARPHLFTGDALFPGGPGNTDGDPARFASLLDDLERKVFAPLGDATWVYAGHGADTTLGAERPHLGAWRARGW